ncbi:MAG: aspartate 1-decarboxylase [Candidatus Aenigmatarchaeota archaeon]
MRWFLSSKIHKARVTSADINYIGSITVDRLLMEKAGFQAVEKVLVVDNDNGERVETYIIPGKTGSGVIKINGGAARLIKKGHEIIIMGFQLSKKPIKAKIVLVDKRNRFVRYL